MKMKTHRGAAKRFRVTGSGKVKRKQAYLRHNMRKRSQDVTPALRKKPHVTVEDLKLVERLLPNR